MNRVYLVGRSGANCEAPKYTANSTAVINFSLATSERRGDATETQWHRIVVYGRFAEIIQPQILKGVEMFVTGKLWTRAWQDKNGVRKESCEIIADTIRVCSRRGEEPQQFNPEVDDGFPNQ